MDSPFPIMGVRAFANVLVGPRGDLNPAATEYVVH